MLEDVRHLAGLRHLIRLELRRTHQTRVGAQRGSPVVRPLDIGPIDDFGGHSWRACGRRCGQRLRLHRGTVDADDADEYREGETAWLMGHTPENCSEPVQFLGVMASDGPRLLRAFTFGSHASDDFECRIPEIAASRATGRTAQEVCLPMDFGPKTTAHMLSKCVFLPSQPLTRRVCAPKLSFSLPQWLAKQFVTIACSSRSVRAAWASSTRPRI